MNNIFNPDFLDFLDCFNKHKVDYLLVGGYSVILHGYPRTTGDMDLWVKRDAKNYKKISAAFACFQLPTFEMTQENFLNVKRFDEFRFGRPPVAIDVITQIKGVAFVDAWPRRLAKSFDNVEIQYISLDDLKTTKKATGCAKDMNDLENL